MNKKRMNKRVICIVIFVIILAILTGGVWCLFSSGRLVYSNQSSSITVVCNSDVIDRYNVAMYYQPRNGSSESSIDVVGVKNLVAEIKSKSNYKTDPTCQTIIFWSSVKEDNYAEARNAYDALISLHKERIFVDSNLRSNQSLFTYEKILNGLTGSGFKNENTFGE